jgi:hypothetical protein
MENSIRIDKMLREDWEQVREIYSEGIATGILSRGSRIAQEKQKFCN